MLKYWGRAFAAIIISALYLYVIAAGIINLSNFPWLRLGMYASYILCICFPMIAVAKQIKINASAYVIFAYADAAIGFAFAVYAVNDIMIKLNFLSGFLGVLFLDTVVRAAVWLLILDMFFWLCDKLKKKYKENMEKWEKMHPMD